MKKNKLFMFIFVSAYLLFSSSFLFAGSKPVFVPGELLVQSKPWASEAKVQAAIKSHGAVVVEEIPRIKVKRIRVPEHALDKVKAALSHNPRFSFAEKNFLGQGAFVPNDAKYGSQWHLPKIDADLGWNLSLGSSSEPIAIIDSGVDPNHPDLADKLIPGRNFLDGSTDTHDVLGHGTAVAGSAAAMGDNIEGVAGVAWDNPIMPLVVLSSDNWAYYSDIAAAIIYAVDNGVRILNISIGGSSSSYTLQNAVDYAWDKGAVIVSSAANQSTDMPYYPAACNHVVAVAATDSSDNLASFSNYGSWIDLSAPGTYIVTTNNGGGYGAWAGTSFSSPITAGVAALMFSENPGLTNTALVNLLTGATDDLGEPGFDSTYGHGRLNAYNAVLAAVNTDQVVDAMAPDVAITSPVDGDAASGTVSVEVSAFDESGVESVELLVDGALAASDLTAPFSFSWDTSGVVDGWHELTARAVDGAGNTGSSTGVSVYIDNLMDEDTISPTVSVTNPVDGEVVSGTVAISASADDDTSVERVDFFINGSFAGSDATAPYNLSWQTTESSDGWCDITAEAVDTSGNIGVSSTVRVEVKNVVEVDATAPSVTLSTNKVGSPAKPKFKFDAYGSDNTGVTVMELYLDGVLVATEPGNTLKWMWQTDKKDSGQHSVTVRALDAAGNVGRASVEVSL